MQSVFRLRFVTARWMALAFIALVPLHSTTAAPPSHTSAPANSSSTTVVLYDGALGGTPDAQGFIYLASPFAQASQTYTNGVTLLDTTLQRSDLAGYFANSALYPPLDRTLGYSLQFTTQVITESHTTNDRAGFSVTILSNESSPRGIELAFWTNEIWAQEGGTTNPFTHAESVAFDTTNLITYTLAISGSAYSLSADGSPLLSGPVRDYTAFVPPPGFPDPYETPNLIFLGDNTSSAQAKITLASVSVTVNEPLRLYLPVIFGDTSP